MEPYLQGFVNFKQNDWVKLLPIAKFAYNNAKNASTGHTPFELNCPKPFMKKTLIPAPSQNQQTS